MLPGWCIIGVLEVAVRWDGRRDLWVLEPVWGFLPCCVDILETVARHWELTQLACDSNCPRQVNWDTATVYCMILYTSACTLIVMRRAMHWGYVPHQNPFDLYSASESELHD